MLGIVNAKWENARNYRCKAKEYSKSSMYTEKVLGIVNARYKNAGKRQSMLKNGRNRQSKVKECPEIVNVRRKNTRNRKCTQKKYSESSMQGARMLGNDKVC